MRLATLCSLVVFLLTVQLPALASNNYTQSARSWHGKSANSLIKSWGIPYQQVPGPRGGTIYVYEMVTKSANTMPTPTQVGVNVSRTGSPVIVNPSAPPSTPMTLKLICRIILEANANGIIVRSRVSGNGC